MILFSVSSALTEASTTLNARYRYKWRLQNRAPMPSIRSFVGTWIHSVTYTVALRRLGEKSTGRIVALSKRAGRQRFWRQINVTVMTELGKKELADHRGEDRQPVKPRACVRHFLSSSDGCIRSRLNRRHHRHRETRPVCFSSRPAAKSAHLLDWHGAHRKQWKKNQRDVDN